MLPVAEFRCNGVVRREYRVAGQSVIVGFGSDYGQAHATAWANGQTIAWAEWAIVRGDDHWHTLQTWRMGTAAEWRRKGLMSALWQIATDEGYTVSTAYDPLSPYSQDGCAFVKHWEARQLLPLAVEIGE